MEVRFLELRDLETLHKWWKENKFNPMDIDDLPTVNGELQGLMVHKDGKDICAGFIINTTVKNGALIEYIVADFHIKDRELRKEALNFLIINLMETCKRMGKKYAYTTTEVKGLIERYEDCGFKKGSTMVTEMLVGL